jgi:hypothetical protein
MKDRDDREDKELDLDEATDRQRAERLRMQRLVESADKEEERENSFGDLPEEPAGTEMDMGNITHTPYEEKRDRSQERDLEREMGYSDPGAVALAGRDRNGELRDPARVHNERAEEREMEHKREIDLSFPLDPCLMDKDELEEYLTGGQDPHHGQNQPAVVYEQGHENGPEHEHRRQRDRDADDEPLIYEDRERDGEEHDHDR